MANFSRNTFNPGKHYVGVRLQQGVPIVDADWNELEDIRKHELEGFLKWFVGNGVPEENDGFRILATPGSENDFVIRGSDDTVAGVGRCLIDGWDVLNEADLRYSEQFLYDKLALAGEWGVAPLLPLTTPTTRRIYQVYLDVWEREVNAGEDPELVNQHYGLETCVRLKREWVVRAAEGTTIPAAPPDHVYFYLATIDRPADQAAILAEQITDLRPKLEIPLLADVQQMAIDAFGTTYTLDGDGQPNLEVSLRDTVNILLRGEFHSTPELQLAANVSERNDQIPIALKDSRGDSWLFFYTNNHLSYMCKEAASGTWKMAPGPLTTQPNSVYPIVLEDNNGDIWVFWDNSNANTPDYGLGYRQYNRATGSWHDPQILPNSAYGSRGKVSAVVDSTGRIWLFWYGRGVQNNFEVTGIWHRIYDGVNWTADTPLPREKPSNLDSDELSIAVSDNSGKIWLFGIQHYHFFTEVNNVKNRHDVWDMWCMNYAEDAWGPTTILSTDMLTDTSPALRFPFALVDRNGDLWIFWSFRRSTAPNSFSIWYKRYNGSWGEEARLTSEAESAFKPFAIEDRYGEIWLFWQDHHPEVGGSNDNNIWYKRSTIGRDWGHTVQLTVTPENTSTGGHLPLALEDNSGNMWMFWVRGGGIWYRTRWRLFKE